MKNEDLEVLDVTQPEEKTITPVDSVQPLKIEAVPIIPPIYREDISTEIKETNHVDSVDIEIVDFNEKKKPEVVREQKIDKEKQQSKTGFVLTITILILLVLIVIFLPQISKIFI